MLATCRRLLSKYGKFKKNPHNVIIICANNFPQKKPLYLLYLGCFFVAMTQILAKNKNTLQNNGHEIIVLTMFQVHMMFTKLLISNGLFR